MAIEISTAAKSAAARLFIRGKRSRVNSAQHGDLLAIYASGVADLVAAGLVSKRRKPKHPEIYLYRGSDATGEIGRAWVASSVPARGEATPVVRTIMKPEEDMVDNPLMTDAEHIAQRRRAEAKGKSADELRKIGKEKVLRNMQTYIGAFGRYHGTEAQIKAAAKFKSLHDRAQIGGGKACDPSVEPVDGGGVNSEAMFEIGADARSLWISTTIWLGRQDFDRFYSVIIAELGPTAYAKRRSGEIVPDGRTINLYTEEVRDIAERLAVRWGYSGKPPSSSPVQGWRDETAKAIA
jgi:hypothetical protein